MNSDGVDNDVIVPTWHFEVYDHIDLEQQFEHT